ncbi:MAG TPA: S8 family serine peptidase, partial [Fimbriimonadaceae bacterium]|nr:S8 family serine peptidase [Fimbriimonadaceae bacterium]
ISAPLSSIYVYDDAESDDNAPVSTLSAVSDDNAVDVMSESWGWATLWNGNQYAPLFASAHDDHLSMSAQGITYLASSGDAGTEYFPQFGTRYAYPDCDEEVAIVGGTVIAVDATSGARWAERTWGLRNHWAGTGGFDPWDTPAIGYPYNVPPSYQKKYIGAKSGMYNYRLVPDFSSAAGGQDGLGNNDGTGWAIPIYYHPSGYSVGSIFYFDGTSFASPASAGALVALEGRLFQYVKPNANRSNVRLGRIQDLLYSLGGNQNIFTDVVAGNSIGNLPGTRIPALPTRGWDFATGWGSPVWAGLYGYMFLSGKI